MSTRQAPYRRSLAQIAGTVLNVFDFAPNGDPTAVTDWWDPIRNAVQFLKESGGGKLIFPVWEYTVLYDATSPAVRDSTMGVIDLSPWEDDGGTWHATENIEIRFEYGARLVMDNLTPNGYDAQTHAVYARCRWTDIDGDPTPSTWSGYAVGYHGIKLVNVRVDWTLGSARGIGDSFRFTGTKSRATAPYDIVLENCSAKNAPQVGAIFIGCRDVDAGNFRAEGCWADPVHFNACWEPRGGIIHAKNCGDDALAVVTYYNDDITLERGLDTEEGPFTSPDITTANNNGLIVKGVQKIGGGAHAVRLLGAYGAQIGDVYVDADGSENVSGVFAGSVKANGTTLAESGLACKKCSIENVIVRNGAQVGIHIVSQGVDGSEGDDWLNQDVAIKGGNISGCEQVSVWAHDCDGYTVRGVKVDSVKVDIANSSKWTMAMECAGDVNISGPGSYAEDDMLTIPAGHGTIESLKMTGGRCLLSDFNTIQVKHFESVNAPGSAFEAIRVTHLIGPPLKITNANRSGIVDLAHIPVRFIPVADCNIGADITHDSTPVQKFIEIGGGDAYNITQNSRIHAIVEHAVAALEGEDPFEIQGGTYAPVNFFRTSRCRDGAGNWTYVNTDDLPLGIVPEITAAEVNGVRTLKVFDALALYATGVLNTLATTLATAGVLGARVIRFLQFAGDEGSAGVIDYGQLQADALSIHGKGTSSTNRKVRIYDNAVVNGTIDASGLVTALDIKATNTTGNQPARFDADNKIKGGKTDLTAAGDVSLGSIPSGSWLKNNSGAVAAASVTAGRIIVSDGSGNPSANAALSSSLVMQTDGAGLPTTISYASLAAALVSALDTYFITPTEMATFAYSKAEVDTLLSGYASTSHGHSGSFTTTTAEGHDHDVSVSF